MGVAGLILAAARPELAAVTVAAFGLGLIVGAILAARQTSYSLGQLPFVLLAHLLVRCFWGLRIRGTLALRPGQGAVLVCNHRCPFDPFFLGATTTRMVHWLVAREFCESKLFGLPLRILETIPTNRSGSDLAATRRAMELASSGALVGMLPEGRINTTAELLLPGRPGAILVALKARVPIVPYYLEGTPRASSIVGTLFVPAQVRLVVGQPLDLSAYYDQHSDKDVLAEITLRVLREIAALAGRPHYEPQLAGRRWKPAS